MEELIRWQWNQKMSSPCLYFSNGTDTRVPQDVFLVKI